MTGKQPPVPDARSGALELPHAVGGPGSEVLIEELGPPLGISELAQAGVLESLQHAQGAIHRRTATVADQRARLDDALRALPVEVPPSQANLLWIAPRAFDGAELARRLNRQGVIVRTGGPLGDPRHVRASIQDAPATDRLLRALQNALGDD